MAAANSLLESADEVIRYARLRTVNWSDGRLDFAASIPSLVANALLAAPASATVRELAGLVDQAFRRRGTGAYNVLVGLRDSLSTTIESLRRVSPACRRTLPNRILTVLWKSLRTRSERLEPHLEANDEPITRTLNTAGPIPRTRTTEHDLLRC